eukprot:CAMPEP_0171701862 /NCGR_PEP_ID=MMETSP0991-20121206/11290_1 /TAXON_ID=483369 /ORGANISM="non described non described, Strain CCMP2098" /LENGTH=50 /DNA_ID=CAMNT_0012291169 /DNA_START=405 /DNA_END=557 /DNA_ORIENTATION=+
MPREDILEGESPTGGEVADPGARSEFVALGEVGEVAKKDGGAGGGSSLRA